MQNLSRGRKEKKKMQMAKIKFLYILFFSISLLSCKKEDVQWNLIKLPEIGYLSIVSNDTVNFDLESNCKSIGFDKNVEMGFCWSSVETQPTLDDNIIYVDNKNVGNFKTTVNWANVPIYYVRAFVKNGIGTVYSQSIIVGWPGSSIPPTIQTTSINNVSFNSFNVNCSVLTTNSQPIISEGIYLSTSPTPTSSNALLTYSSTNGLTAFSNQFNGLDDNTTYYVRGFVNTLGGEGLGNVLSVTLPKKYTIGETGPAGGTIFYENPDIYGSWHYLEVAPNDVVGSFIWSPITSQSNITSTSISNGVINTNQIVGLYGNSSNYAARAAYTYNFGGSSDWALPTLDELKLLKELLHDNGIGNFSNGSQYWTSSEDAHYFQNAWTVKMINTGNNMYTTQSKNLGFKIRCIRKF